MIRTEKVTTTRPLAESGDVSRRSSSGSFGERSVERGESSAPRARGGSGGLGGSGRGVFERAVELPPGASLGQLARVGALQSSDLARLGLADAAALSSTLDGIAALPDDVTNKTFKAFQAVLPDVATAYELLNEAPATHQEITAQITRLRDVEARLANHEQRFGTKDFGDDAVNDLRDEITQDLGPLRRSLTDRVAYLRGMAAANPMSEKNIFSAKALYIDAAIKVVDEKRVELLGQGKDLGDRELVALTQAKQVLVDRKTQFARLDSDATVQGKLKDFMGEKKPTLSAKRLLDKVMKGVDLLSGGQPALPTHHKGIREQAILERFLGRAFKQAGVKPPNLKHALHDAHIDVLNKQNWNTITKDVRFSHQGKDVRFTSKIDPQGQLGDKYGDPQTGMRGGGINCHCSKEHEQAVNVAATEISDAGGNVLMRGVRHGVNCAYGISTKELKHASVRELKELARALLPQGDWVQTGGAPDLDATVAKMRKSESFRRECADTMRAAANMNRAKDVVTSALVMDPAKLQQAIADAQNGVVPPTVQLDISSISLMTPDLGRSWKSGNAMAKDNERRMVPEQIEAWNRLTAGSPVTLKVADPANPGRTIDVQVKVDVLAFNFGVNQGAVKGVGPISSKRELVSGWALADRHNRLAMDKLIGTGAERSADGALHGRIGAWLHNNPGHPKAAIVRQLAQQVEQIWDSGSYKTQGNEPYKMVSRLALLTHLTEGTPAWNCKSGKDRTGELDVEVKFLAAQIELTGSVPQPDRVRTKEEQAQFFQMAISSGNHDMQQLNTGGMGFKLEGVDALSRQMGTGDDDPHVGVHRGISKFFES